MLRDKFYDHNKDGELDVWETMERDAQIEFDEKMRQNAKEETKFGTYNANLPNCYDSKENKPHSIPNLENQSCLLLLAANIVIIGGVIFAITADINDWVSIIILFVSLGLGIFLLKIGGWYK